MTERKRSLALLTAAFSGSLPKEEEWLRVLELANRAWLTPALLLALEDRGVANQVSEQVLQYLRLLHDRNAARNRRLLQQLAEATAVLNHFGITPILLKGATSLVEIHTERIGARMMSDIDLAVDPVELEQSIHALASIGYRSTEPRAMARDHDAGEIELHVAPLKRIARYLPGDLRHESRPVNVGGRVAMMPNPTARVLHLFVHDLIKEGDFMRCRLDLRHLHDVACLANSPEGVDWERIAATMNDAIGRAALDVQLLALRHLFQVEVVLQRQPWQLAQRWHEARLAAAAGGAAAIWIRSCGKLLYGLHRLVGRSIQMDARSPNRLLKAIVSTPRSSRI